MSKRRRRSRQNKQAALLPVGSVNVIPAVPPNLNGPGAGRYAAATDSKFRGRVRVKLAEEDDHLPQADRDKVQTAVLDESRSYANLGWAVRKHLDFVAEHSFAAETGDKTLNDDLEGLVAEWSEPENFDVRGRMGLRDWIRTAEGVRTAGGDMLAQKIDNGTLQAIEPDRIRDPEQKFSDRWRNGALLNAAGRITHFAIHRRTGGGTFKFETIRPADEFFHFGYFQRFDQARGVTPIAAALNDYRDTASAKTLALAKMRIQQIFGAVVNVEDPQASEINLSDGPFVAEIGLDEKMQFLNDNTPSSQFDSFLRHVIAIALKALDIPLSFYQEDYTNFFGSRAALNLYLISTEAKRRSVQSLTRHLTRWRINYEIAVGRFRLPRSIADVSRLKFRWIPRGFPWWNPVQEAAAAEKMLQLRLMTRAEIRQEIRGDNWFDVIDRLETEEKELADRFAGRPVPGSPTPSTATPDSAAAATIADLQERIAELENRLAASAT